MLQLLLDVLVYLCFVRPADEEKLDDDNVGDDDDDVVRSSSSQAVDQQLIQGRPASSSLSSLAAEQC